MELEFLKHFDLKKLAGTLVLLAVILAISGYFLITAPDEPHFGFFVLVVVILIFIVAVLHIYEGQLKAEQERRTKAEGAANQMREIVEGLLEKGRETQGLWTTQVLQKLKPNVIRQAFDLLNATREEAFKAMQELQQDVELDNIRVNIFLPNNDGPSDGHMCELEIPRHETAAPNGLQVGMDDSGDRLIRFRPHQGATGRVFVERYSIGVLTNREWLDEQEPERQQVIPRWLSAPLHPKVDMASAEGGEFQMTKLQDKTANPVLAWIISMPLIVEFDGRLETIGVFNVDCLMHQILAEHLRAIYYRVSPLAAALSGLLHGLQTDRITILRIRS